MSKLAVGYTEVSFRPMDSRNDDDAHEVRGASGLDRLARAASGSDDSSADSTTASMSRDELVARVEHLQTELEQERELRRRVNEQYEQMRIIMTSIQVRLRIQGIQVDYANGNVADEVEAQIAARVEAQVAQQVAGLEAHMAEPGAGGVRLPEDAATLCEPSAQRRRAVV